MGEGHVMICHNGRCVASDKEKNYVGGEEKGVVSKSIKLMEFLEIVLKIMCCGVDMITLAYSIPMGAMLTNLCSLGTKVICDIFFLCIAWYAKICHRHRVSLHMTMRRPFENVSTFY